MKNIAIIPARSGSKGLPDKNIKLLNNKPLLSYTIESALESGIFDEIHVSTDSEEYAEIARKYGASVPFLRPVEFSTDKSSTLDTVKMVLQSYKNMGLSYDICTLLQPTSPLRGSDNIKKAMDVFYDKNAHTVISVCQVEHPVQWCFYLPDNGSMKEFSKSPYRHTRRQDLTAMYRENGAIYIFRTEDIILDSFDIYRNGCFAYIMNKDNSIDIDDEIDFKLAEIYISKVAHDVKSIF